MDIGSMTYMELGNQVSINRWKIKEAKDARERMRLCAENHDLMTEMDRRWNDGEMKTRIVGRK